MSTGEMAGQTFHYATPDRLRIGLYIHIDLPWFLHPFTLSSFKISSEQQVSELRALKLSRYRYDPQLSENASVDDPAIKTNGNDEPAAPAEQSGAAEPFATETNPRVVQLREHRKAVLRTEKSFVKALGVMRRLDKSLLSSPAATLEEMGGLVAQMVSVFILQPDVTLQVMGENCGGEEAYHHSLNVSILCMMLVKGLKLTGEQAGVLGIGALLHDLGLIEIPDRIAKQCPDEQTRPERELRARHVEFGVKIGRRLGLAPEVLSIIEQHHELADGSGYPRGLELERITPLARIVALVNFYENLCNPIDFSLAMTPHEALSFIFARRKSQFDAQILQLMIRSLGVYPPGSIVRLSNASIAMVLSVNPQKALRPWVLLYDARVPKDHAAMLNLETDDAVNISAPIRPAMLPAHIYAYLSPRKRITYFFDAGTSTAAKSK